MSDHLRRAVLSFFPTAALFFGIISGSTSLTASEINPLKEALFTEVIGEVKMGKEGSSALQSVKVGDTFTENNFLHTGADAKVEMKASDQTTIRLGSNALFRFGPGGRELNLDEGTLLLQAPKGFGGGKIITPTAVAAARGTTFMVTTTENGGFKCSCLESKVALTTSSGVHQTIGAGQVSFILPGGKIGLPITIDLARAVKTSGVVSGFSKPVASLSLIQKSILQQQTLIQGNHLQQTGQVLLGSSGPDSVEIGSGGDALFGAENNVGALNYSTADPRKFVPIGISQFVGITRVGSGPDEETNPRLNFNSLLPIIKRVYLQRDIQIDFSNIGPDRFGVLTYGNVATENGDIIDDDLLFLSRNIEFNTPRLNFATGGGGSAEVFAWNNIQIDQGFTVSRNTVGQVTFTANTGSINFANGLAITANPNSNVNSLQFQSNTGFNLVNDSFINYSGGVLFRSEGPISMQGGTIMSVSNILFRSIGNLFPNSDINIKNVQIIGNPRQITIVSGPNPGNAPNFGNLDYSRAGSVSLSNVMFPTSVQNIAIIGQTVNLMNVNFTGMVSLRSSMGMLNVGSSRPGYVNYLGGVMYNGSPALNYTEGPGSMYAPGSGQPIRVSR